MQGAVRMTSLFGLSTERRAHAHLSRPLHVRVRLPGAAPPVPGSPTSSSSRACGRTAAWSRALAEPDGTAANIFYRVPDEAALGRLLEENEFNRAGLFTAQHPRAFADFLEPIELPPIDEGLETTMVEGRPADHALARAALAALQRHGRVAFGGFFADGAGLAVLRCASTDQAVAWLAAAVGWEPGRLRGRPWSQTL